MPLVHSIRMRYTLATSAVFAAVLIVIGVSLDLTIRYKIQDDIRVEERRAAAQWSDALRDGALPNPIPASRGVPLVQLVDARGRVVDSSRQAAGRPPLSAFRPPPYSRLQKRTECPLRGRCVILMANRVSFAADSPVLYAGVVEPGILVDHGLEGFIGLAGLLVMVSAAGLTWWIVGHTLHPVAGIRARMAEVTASDLSLRVPMPPGDDEIAQLAHTANETLARLEEAVGQQQRFLTTATHELSAPIAGLRERLEKGLRRPGGDAHETIRGALAVTDRLEMLIGDLLLMARLRADPATPEPVDVGALVREQASAFSGEVPMYVEAAGGLRVFGSRRRLSAVIANLLNIGRRHADTEVRISVRSVAGQAVVTVVDDGPRVTAGDRARAFDNPPNVYCGSHGFGCEGMVLVICREIVHDHRGDFVIKESPRGVRFVLRLPLIS